MNRNKIEQALISVALLPLKAIIWCVLTVGFWLTEEENPHNDSCPAGCKHWDGKELP